MKKQIHTFWAWLEFFRHVIRWQGDEDGSKSSSGSTKKTHHEAGSLMRDTNHEVVTKSNATRLIYHRALRC